MSEISDAIKRNRAGRVSVCLTNEWLSTLPAEDEAELSAFAGEHPASAFAVAKEFGFGACRSTWTGHFKGLCSCVREI